MKYAICNWLFRGADIRRSCETVARHGFQGLEIAHFTLCDDPHAVSEATVREIREALQDAGLAFVGFHALLFRPADLHITSVETAVRTRARDHLRTKAERLSWAALIEEYFDIIRHVHLNAVDGGVPTTDNADFAPAFRTLAAKQYAGWVSLEIFHQPENPDTVLGATRRFLADMEARIRA